ncbi:hypothetical protein [Haloferax sp. DFSO60]|uniref:hypothetical protein n=1 Tax=Haloferax sp. DFSO60 TaxID=3388652 RepID=UPI00397DF5D1
MPSRRQFIWGLGTAFVGGFAGIASLKTTTGIVKQKSINVGLQRESGNPFDLTIAHVTYSQDQKLVMIDYANIIREVIEDGSLFVSKSTHERLANQFAYVDYFVNIVPSTGPTTANGFLSRTGFNSLEMGGTAKVIPYMKPVELNHSVGHVKLIESTPPKDISKKTKIYEYNFEDRVKRFSKN